MRQYLRIYKMRRHCLIMNIDGELVRLASNADAFRTSARLIRLRKGLTQAEVANLTGVSRRWLSRFETGEDPEGVELQKALDVARALGLNTLLADSAQ